MLTADAGVAGTDYCFDLAATAPVATGYVFPDTANFFDALNVDSPSQHRLTLSDFYLNGVDVAASVNDLVATVVIGTGADFSGNLALSVDVDGLILDTPDVSPTPVQGFVAIKMDTGSATSATVIPVPEPGAASIAGAALLGGWLWCVLARQTGPVGRRQVE